MDGEPAVYTRADGVRGLKLKVLMDLQSTLVLAETYGLDDDPWVSRLYDAYAAVERELQIPRHPSRRRTDPQARHRECRLHLVK